MGFLDMFLDYIFNGKFSVIFHDIILGGFLSALTASFLRSQLFAFLNQILFDLVCIQFVFGFQTDLSETLCCLATLCIRGVLLVTFFVLDCSWPLCCRSAGLVLVVGRLEFVFFWSKQHLICTDQNVSATPLSRHGLFAKIPSLVLDLKIGSLESENNHRSLESEKTINHWSLESEKIGSLESEKSGPYRSISGT